MTEIQPHAGNTLAAPDAEARRARHAISIVFLLNGVSFCAILPRFPEIVDNLHISNTELGTAVALGPVGGLFAGMFAARIMRRFNSGPTAVTAQICATTAQVLIFIAPSWIWLALGFIAAAACDAVTDIAQNAHGMRVERRYGRSIMNSYHGFWSLGAVLGGVIGAVCAQCEVPLWVQGVGSFAIYGICGILNYPRLLKGADSTHRSDASVTTESELMGPSPASAHLVPSDPAARHSSSGLYPAWRAWAALIALGMLLVFAGSAEDAGNTWGALYMKSTFDAMPFVAGLAFIALQGTQMIARFLGDRLVDALGDRATARLGGAIACLGMTIAMLLPHPVTVICGFAATGWGIATLFPAAFRAGDDMPGLASGVGITFVGWFSRIGFFITPPLVGVLADAFTLRYVLWLVPLYALGILIFSSVLEPEKRADKLSPSVQRT